MTTVRRPCIVPVLVGLAVLLSASDAAAEGTPREIALGECLVLRSVGRSGRSAVHVDAVEALLVAGKWKAPKAGDTVALPDGSNRTWATATAKKGVLENAALQGGYAFWAVKSPAPRVMLLEASGQLVAYVNGEPRAGDPYQIGIVRVPVLLRAGDNELLFLCGRGRLQAKLVEPDGPASLDDHDATLPDYRAGESSLPWAAVVAINASDKPLTGLKLEARAAGAEPVTTPCVALPPLATRKVGFRLPICKEATGEAIAVEVSLLATGRDTPLAAVKFKVRLRRPEQSYKRTFVSGIDDSVQYFAVQPATPAAEDHPALVLTLHGAGVEAIGQADAYRPKAWCHIVAATNRRPYGFDWEDWGRLDALEVLTLAKKQLDTDPRRTYLTGHSMGGHGTWQVGVNFPDHFAAIAPSAGWVSFASYAGGRPADHPTPLQAMLRRSAASGETLTLVRNLARDGVYVLHGDADDNVPVSEARTMRKELGTFHTDFAYYERPGAGHWWGSECVDWPPLFDFLQRHTLPRLDEVRRVNFTTASPGVSARCDWAEVGAQAHALQPSSVHLRLDPAHAAFSGTTENVTRLALDSAMLPAGQSVSVEIDGQKLTDLARPAGDGRLWLNRNGDQWSVGKEPATNLKGPNRYGPFKEAFRNHVQLVYGTRGTPEENALNYAKARFDAETFWYRGNGALALCADVDFDPARDPDRNVVLYGNAENNAAWHALLPDNGPVRVGRGGVRIGDREVKGDDLACLFVRPRPGSALALVGAVGGTGPAGIRLTGRLPYFLSGAGFPDLIVFGADSLTRGADGVRVAGFFGTDWGVPTGDWAWPGAGK